MRHKHRRPRSKRRKKPKPTKRGEPRMTLVVPGSLLREFGHDVPNGVYQITQGTPGWKLVTV